MRILLINTLYPPLTVGGAERSVQELAIALTERGHVVGVLSQLPSSSTIARSDTVAGVRVERWTPHHVWQFGDEWATLNSIQKLKWHFRDDLSANASNWVSDKILRFRPDIINSHNIAGFGTAVWRASEGIPLVHTLRDYYLLCTRTTLYRTDRRCEGRCLDCSFLTQRRIRNSRRPDIFIGVSQHILDIHRRFGVLKSDSRSAVVYNQPDIGSPSRIDRSQESVTAGSHTFGFIGRIEPAKGINVIIDAFRRVANSNARLIVSGSGRPDQVEWINRQIEIDDRISYTGQIAADEFYNRVQCVVVPTQWDEPFGRVAWESVQYEKRIIASRVGGIPEAIGRYAKVGYVTNFRDPLEWKSAMEREIANRQKDISSVTTANRSSSIRYVSPGDAYEKIFEQLIGEFS